MLRYEYTSISVDYFEKKKMFECFQIDLIETIYFQNNSWENIDSTQNYKGKCNNLCMICINGMNASAITIRI